MLEVCVDNVQGAMAAERAGAQRLELCAALDVGGVTPAKSLIDAVRRRVECPLMILVRPRTGNFIYDALDYQQTLATVEELVTLPIQGIVVGGLDAEGQLDISLLRAVREAVPEHIELVMHRAFDFVRDMPAALEQLIALRFARVLTSGGSGYALENVERLQSCIEQFGQRITIMPGGGINADNALAIIQRTACRQLHGSFRITLPSSPGNEMFGTHRAIDVEGIARVRGWLDQQS